MHGMRISHEPFDFFVWENMHEIKEWTLKEWFKIECIINSLIKITFVNIILGESFYFANYNCLEYRGINNFHYPNNNDYFKSLDSNNHEENLSFH